MNPSSGNWCNPPPPGTDDVGPPSKRASPGRVIDKIDPFLKSSEYLKYEKRGVDRGEHSRRRSRSRSRHRRRRSRSRHRHRRRRHSSSRSRSRSPKRHRKRHSRSRSPSRPHKSHKTRHRSRKHTRSRSLSRSKSRSMSATLAETVPDVRNVKQEEDVEDEEEDNANENVFKNDGSFMEMFKKMQEEQQRVKVEAEKAAEAKSLLPAFGKRRGGKVLKTGMVEKHKTMTEEESNAQDAWTMYMKEVKKYKEACCDDDSKTRLLVK